MMEKCFDEGTLQAFLDNELTPELSQKVARHMADCDPCAILLAEVEEETAFAFAALDQEFNTLVPTQRLWTKINESIATDGRKRGFWQYLLTFVSGFNLTNPSVAAFASLLFVVATFAVLMSVKSDSKSNEAAVNSPSRQSVQPDVAPQVVTPVVSQNPQSDTLANVDKVENKPASVNSPFRVERASFEKRESPRKTNGSPSPAITDSDVKAETMTAQYVPGEESYLNTISRLEKTVNSNKDEVLKSSERFSYEKDMAIVNDAIKKMQKEVKKNPKNDGAKQILFASYQNKIDLLNSVTERSELMASLR